MSSVNSWLSRQLAVQGPCTRRHSSSLSLLSHQPKCISTSTSRVAGGILAPPRVPRPKNATSIGRCCQRRELATSGGHKDRHRADVTKDVDDSRMRQERPKKKKKNKEEGRMWETPSQLLISALKYHGYKVDMAEVPSHVRDLSHADPRSSGSNERSQLNIRKTRVELAPLKPPTILAKYITFLHNFSVVPEESGKRNSWHDQAQNKAILRVFDEPTLEFLTKRGYSACDIMVWAWIITAQRPSQAAQRLWAFEEQNVGSRNRIPVFILLFILRQQNLNAAGLRILLLQTWRMLGNNRPPGVATINESAQSSQQVSAETEASRSWNLSGDEATIMILIVRLLRHAREVWPQALLSIATMMTTHIGKTALSPDDPKFNEKTIQRLTFAYNRGLKLLSLPCRRNPYQYVPIQQQAQFRLLRRMTEFDPPLAVTEEGYRAITSVQLTHRKTAVEQNWAKFKAVTWPPWKEEKLGIDSERGNEGSKSRAMESMSQMVAGGYSHGRWEQIATVFSGWDTDKSPTIQKRVLLPKPNAFRKADTSTSGSHHIWAARIRATRTLKEAWACFLSYQDQYPPNQEVYFAMGEKIISRGKTRDELLDEEDAPLPGDGKEVFPEPSSPRDVIYTRSEPPHIEAFFDQMLSHGILPSRRFLAFLLASAKSFKTGMKYLRYGDLPPTMTEYLYVVSSQGGRRQDIEGNIPSYFFASFIEFLCNVSRFDRDPDETKVHFDEAFPVIFPGKSSIEKYVLHREASDPASPHALAFKHAAMLMKRRKPRYGPPWHHLLSGLTANRISTGNHGEYLALERVLAWGEAMEVLDWMEDAHFDLDFEGFQIICTAFERAVFAGRQDVAGAERGLAVLAGPHRTFEDVVRAGLKLLKGHFDRIVLPENRAINLKSFSLDPKEPQIDPSYLLPAMLEVPSPANLHTFIRALGVAKDFDGLLSLLRWMNRFATDLKTVADERHGARRNMRRAIVAVRVHLEDCWDTEPTPGSRFSNKDENGERRVFDEIDLKEWDEMQEGEEGEEGEESPPPPTFTDPKLQEAYDIIESTKTWGPWPSDEEVAAYVAHWRFPIPHVP